MNNFPDLPEENQHVFVTIACQCGVQGLQSNCCQGDRAHLDVSGLYQTDGYPSEMSLQLKEYVYDICSTTRSIIGENVLEPSGEGAGGIGAGGDSKLEDEGGMKPVNGNGGDDNGEGEDGPDTSWISDALDDEKDIVDTNGENGDTTGGENGNGDVNCHLYTKKQGCNKGAAECVWDAQLMKCIDITVADNVTPEVEESRAAPTMDEPSGLSAGAIAGIAIAGVVGLILAILVIRYFLRDDKVDNDEDANKKKSPLGGSNSAPPPNLEDLRTMNSLDGENPRDDNDQIYDTTLGGSKTRPPSGWASKQRVQV